MRKTVYALFDNKAVDQPAHLCSVMSIVVILSLDSIIPVDAIPRI